MANPSDAQYIINGLGRLMCSQYLSTQGLNGEGTMALYYGEYPSQTCQKANLTGWSSLINLMWTDNNSSANNIFPWHYNYRLILNANTVIANIPEIDDPSQVDLKNEWGYIKAQALCYRAHAYLRLVQHYSRRWSDRKGESRGVVLRLEPTSDKMACSSLKEVYEQIYKDCDEAATLFKNSDKYRSATWLPSEEVAHAIKSRAALNREDWQTSISEAQLACAKSKLMTSTEYESGFSTPNSEWIWCAYNGEEQDIYYYSFFAYTASNSKSTSCRTYPLLIDRKLVEKIPASDTRLKLYAIPTADELPPHPKLITNSGTVTFTDDKGMEKLTTQDAKDNAVAMNAFYNRIKAKGSFINGRLYSTTTVMYYLGTKFQAVNDLGVGQLCLYRMAEMLYNQAESYYRLGKESDAQATLEKLVKPFQADYKCTSTGAALLDEITTYRSFDLWGEGFSWYDMKRRGDTLKRVAWTDGGNWNASFKVEYGPQDKNRWTFVIPKIETEYNTLVQSIEGDNWPN